MVLAERLERMRPEGSGGGGGGVSGAKPRVTDDDLADGFEVEDPKEIAYGGQLAEEMLHKRQGGDGEEEGEEEEGEEEDGEEGEEDGDKDEEEGEGEEVVMVPTPSKQTKGGKAAAALPSTLLPELLAGSRPKSAELPYVMECPGTPSELSALMAMAGNDASRQAELLHRLVAGHHAKLNEANRPKLLLLVQLLLQRHAALAEHGTAAAIALMHPLCPALYSLAEQMPAQTAPTPTPLRLVSVPEVDAEPTPAASLAPVPVVDAEPTPALAPAPAESMPAPPRSEEHTSELQSR